MIPNANRIVPARTHRIVFPALEASILMPSTVFLQCNLLNSSGYALHCIRSAGIDAKGAAMNIDQTHARGDRRL